MSDRVQGIGKIKSKYLIFDILSYSFLRDQAVEYLFTSSTIYRSLLLKNLQLLSFTHPLLIPLKVWSPFDILVQARPLPPSLAIEPQFIITHNIRIELENISKYTTLIMPKMQVQVTEKSMVRTLQVISKWRPVKLTIIFEHSGMDFSLLPQSIKSLILKGSLTSCKGMQAINIPKLKISTNDNKCMIEALGKYIIPTK
ncbi:hypothetical protein FGO68_gene12225 [Halteria grandinella]|uniref:Uncharacterized protein n=1 Tax=Halteria grandinella TaxID=5974 RepID=A0A8J8NXH0_HALGN|nr:hypothetical protein FGO68_gene12225 [Halteria grandinella]